jgi:folate-binding protein YgfZ
MPDQYRIIAARAGWVDQSARGRLVFSQQDAVPFLQALVTNDVAKLSRGQGVYAAYLTPQGRMIADIDLFHRGDWLLGSTGEGLGPAMAARFDALIFSEVLTVTDATAEWAEIAVTGGGAVALLASALDCDPVRLEALPELAQEDWGGGFIVRAGASPFPMFRIVLPTPEREAVIARLEQSGIEPMPETLATALRIEAGRAAWGHDLSPETIPLEAGLLERAISTSKGCYVGQEIIIRILHRGGGRVARRLVTLVGDAGLADVPRAGAALGLGGAAVGHVTSAAFSPGRGAVVALGYVHRDAAEVGRVLTVGEGAATAEIVGFAR